MIYIYIYIYICICIYVYSQQFLFFILHHFTGICDWYPFHSVVNRPCFFPHCGIPFVSFSHVLANEYWQGFCVFSIFADAVYLPGFLRHTQPPSFLNGLSVSLWALTYFIRRMVLRGLPGFFNLAKTLFLSGYCCSEERCTLLALPLFAPLFSPSLTPVLGISIFNKAFSFLLFFFSPSYFFHLRFHSCSYSLLFPSLIIRSPSSSSF